MGVTNTSKMADTEKAEVKSSSDDVSNDLKNLKVTEDTENHDPKEDQENAEAVVCAYCKKASGPTKRCGKRHPKCIKKLFCNETCENLSHKKKEDANNAAKVAAKKVDAKKKKDKKKNPLFAFNSENRI